MIRSRSASGCFFPAENSENSQEMAMPRRLDRGQRLVVASHNPGKVEEIEALLAPYRIEAVGAAAGWQGVRLRPNVRAGRLRADLRRAGARAETQDQPPRPRLRQAGRGLSLSSAELGPRASRPHLPALEPAGGTPAVRTREPLA